MSPSARRPPTVEELEAAVLKQMRFIVNSGKAVLEGDLDEAVRLAVAARVLLHDANRSHSILEQLGWKSRLQFVSILRPLEDFPGVSISLRSTTGESVGVTRGLVVLRSSGVNGTLRYEAPLDGGPDEELLQFDPWWTEKVLHSEGTPTFSRWDIVDSMAHRDGGAHLDPKGLSPEYEQYKLKGTGGFSYPLPMGTTTFSTESLDPTRIVYPGDAASPTMLQIGWEILETLNRSGLLPTLQD